VVERTDVVLQWNQQALLTGGPHVQRTLTMTHLAMFDAVNAIEPRYTPYLVLPAPTAGASPEAAGAAAAYGVLVRVLPGDAAMLRAALARSLVGLPEGPSKAAGLTFGDLVAEAMVAAHRPDGPHAIPVAERQEAAPGDYQSTIPASASPSTDAAGPGWTPFTLTSTSQFRPDPPPPLTSALYAKDLDEVRRLGASVSSARPAADEQLARWHAEPARSQWNRIARTVAATDGGDLLDHARLFALLNVALADAETGAFEAVYTFRFWRPVTAIRNADRDANPGTTADRVWSPLLPMPRHPEYPSVQAAGQAAAVRVLTAIYGRFHPFSATSRAVTGVTRAYRDFEAFASEDASAEILGGLHFRTSIDRGAQEGRKVAEWVLERCLLPADQERATTRCSRNAQALAAAMPSPASSPASPSPATRAAPPPSPSR
jgi:hypothetical protein